MAVTSQPASPLPKGRARLQLNHIVGGRGMAPSALLLVSEVASDSYVQASGHRIALRR